MPKEHEAFEEFKKENNGGMEPIVLIFVTLLRTLISVIIWGNWRNWVIILRIQERITVR